LAEILAGHLAFFLGGFLASRFGAFLFPMPTVYAIRDEVQALWILHHYRERNRPANHNSPVTFPTVW
jgi:hypothetical protein